MIYMKIINNDDECARVHLKYCEGENNNVY